MRYILLILLSSCVSREQVEGQLWFTQKIPDRICVSYPEVKNYGVYRTVSCKDFPNAELCKGNEDSYELYIPYCSQRIKEFKAAEDKYVQQWLNKLGRPKKK